MHKGRFVSYLQKSRTAGQGTAPPSGSSGYFKGKERPAGVLCFSRIGRMADYGGSAAVLLGHDGKEPGLPAGYFECAYEKDSLIVLLVCRLLFVEPFGGSPPLIGVSESCDEGRVRVTRTYVDAVLAAGGIPVVIPLMRDTACLSRLFERLDGLVLIGGGDVDPARFDAEPSAALGHVDTVRDAYDFALLDLARVGIFPCWAFAAASS